MFSKEIFDIDCHQCPRLDDFLCAVKQKYPMYHARPVAPFGDLDAHLLVVGLAPGMHGANATGRPFTQDYAGILLYEALYEFGFSNKMTSESLNDGLVLSNCRITNAVKCLPPQNKPNSDEIKQCNHYLTAELNSLTENSVILALGSIAHLSVLKALNVKQSAATFSHNAVHALPRNLTLIDSYHTSRYNVQTKRLTKEMFTEVFINIQECLTQSSD
ncbi:MAG: uracil-DNA glycosylase [Methylococcales bacterium]|nr:uracil-DNA glycosylase [Methylococcales bacterium]